MQIKKIIDAFLSLFFLVFIGCLIAANAHGQGASSKLKNLAPTQKTLDLEAGKIGSRDAIRIPPQKPGETYRATVLLPFATKVTEIRYVVNDDGEAVFGGDMLLGPAQQLQTWSVEYNRLLQSGVQPSLAIDDARYRWPNGILLYKVSSHFGSKAVKVIENGINVLNSQTNVSIVPYDKQVHKDYVSVVLLDEDDPAGGQSRVGRQGGKQKLWLKTDTSESTVIHEFMHALGFRHEHQRPDRDQYVQIKLHNVMDKYKANFTIDDGNFAVGPYDKDSVMHYGGYAFNKSCDLTRLASGQRCGRCDDVIEYNALDGKCYVTIKDLGMNKPFKDKNTLSAGDIEAVNALYPEEIAGNSLPPVSRMRTLRTTVQRLITRAGPNESKLCGKNTDFVLQMQVGPVFSTPNIVENAFNMDRTSSWQTDRPERSSDFRPNWRLDAPVDANTDLMRVDVYVYDHDDLVCGGKDDVVDVNPTQYAFLRLLVNTANGDWSHLKYEKHPVSQVPSYPVNSSRGGNIFDPSTGQYKTLMFNGLKDGEIDYNDEAEIHLQIELL